MIIKKYNDELEQIKKCPRCGSKNLEEIGGHHDSSCDLDPTGFECIDCGYIIRINKSNSFNDKHFTK